MSEPKDGPWALTLKQGNLRRQSLELLRDERADERIRALTEVEAYYAVKEIGLEDSLPVLALLEPHQVKAILDLEIWHHHQFEIPDLLIWLRAFREAKTEQLSVAARCLDLEALALLFRRRLLVALKPKDDEDTGEDPPAWLQEPAEGILPLVDTPDGRFVIAARAVDELDDGDSDRPVDEEERKAILELIDELYKDEDWEYIAGALRLASNDLSSTLEEDALRFRTARLEDLGFPPYERALEIYGLFDLAKLEHPPVLSPAPILEEQLPALYAQVLEGSLFDRAMATLGDDSLVRRIEGDLVPAANAILIADGREPGDLVGLRASLLALRGYLEIALAYQAPREHAVEIAAARLTGFHLSELFRAGYTVTVRLASRAKALAGKLKLDGAEQAVLEALSKRRPRYAPVLDKVAASLASGASLAQAMGVGLDETQGLAPPRAFGSGAELDAARLWVESWEALAQAMESLEWKDGAELGVVIPPPHERSTQVLIATATAQALLGQAFRPVALGAEALLDLADRVGPAEPEALAAEVAARLAGQPAALVARGQAGAEALRQALLPLVGASEIDPRFLGIVLCRLG
jgi:hypothetical protein